MRASEGAVGKQSVSRGKVGVKGDRKDETEHGTPGV